MTRLSPRAKASLDALAEKHLAYTIAKATIEAQLKQELAERLSSYKTERDMALRLACEAGVPRTQLGKAIGTSNYATVQEILALTLVPEHVSSSGNGKWFLIRISDNRWSLSIKDLGPQSLSGTAEVDLSKGDITYVSGDEFVIPQIYVNGLADEVLETR
jgi:hypothetical protein